MKKYSLLAVFLLLMCNVSVCGQTGRILFVDTTFIEKTNLQRIHHSPIYYSGNPVLKADKKWELNNFLIKGMIEALCQEWRGSNLFSYFLCLYNVILKTKMQKYSFS